jgi:hypothetical protein
VSKENSRKAGADDSPGQNSERDVEIRELDTSEKPITAIYTIK